MKIYMYIYLWEESILRAVQAYSNKWDAALWILIKSDKSKIGSTVRFTRCWAEEPRKSWRKIVLHFLKKPRNRQYFTETMTDAYNTDNQKLFENAPAQAESFRHNLEPVVRDFGLRENENNAF